MLFRLTAKKHQSSALLSFWRESALNWWIPLTKGWQCRKHFCVIIMSSWQLASHWQFEDTHNFEIININERIMAWHLAHNPPPHNDVVKWKHFPRYWPFVWGIHRSPVNSPHKGQWRRSSMFPLISIWINGWANNRDAGDLKLYHAHYDVTVMLDQYMKHHLLIDRVTWQRVSPMIISVNNSIYYLCRGIKSLDFGRFEWNFRWVIFKLNLVVEGCGISCEIVLDWLSLELTDDKSNWFR